MDDGIFTFVFLCRSVGLMRGEAGGNYTSLNRNDSNHVIDGALEAGDICRVGRTEVTPAQAPGFRVISAINGGEIFLYDNDGTRRRGCGWGL